MARLQNELGPWWRENLKYHFRQKKLVWNNSTITKRVLDFDINLKKIQTVICHVRFNNSVGAKWLTCTN